MNPLDHALMAGSIATRSNSVLLVLAVELNIHSFFTHFLCTMCTWYLSPNSDSDILLGSESECGSSKSDSYAGFSVVLRVIVVRTQHVACH